MNDPCPVALRGIVPSLNTPLSSDGSIDTASLGRLVDLTADSGCAGMLILAVAGEGQNFSEPEWQQVAETVIGHNAGRLPLIVSVTADNQATRLARAKLSRDLGADGILCQVPSGANPQTALGDVADAGPDLLMIQDLDWQGPGLAIAEIVGLFERLPQFQCLKIETVPAGPKYSAVLAATGGRLHVSGGWAVSQMMDALARGVHAFMPTELERHYVAIHRLYKAGDITGARAHFETLLPILAFANQHIDVSIRFFKHLRMCAGTFETDRCTPGVAPLDQIQCTEAKRLAAYAMQISV
ncbi:MAG: dihydrodipicolinate synthase family protein [Alphaproteobacteria bacterium]